MIRFLFFTLLALAFASQPHSPRNKHIRARALIKRQSSPSNITANVGSIKPAIAPLAACMSNNPAGSACDTANGACCATGSVCRGKICSLICTLDSTEAYCDSTTPCNAIKGYACTANRCRPPATASRVAVGQACDQGAGNSLFCIPAKELCVNSICTKCTN